MRHCSLFKLILAIELQIDGKLYLSNLQLNIIKISLFNIKYHNCFVPQIDFIIRLVILLIQIFLRLQTKFRNTIVLMGNGCLKPTPRSGEIYIDCINKIYEEVKQFQNLQLKIGTDLYTLIKQKIHKKGWLRKLMDNLMSHRQSISEAALHNFRLMAQTKGTSYKVTGLIVIDYIISVVLRQSGLENSQKISGMVLKMIREKDINAQSQYEQSEQKRQSPPPKLVKNQTPYTQSSLQNIQNYEFNASSQINQVYLVANSNFSTLTNQPKTSQNNHLMLRQIYNAKFSNIFYNMIQSLISTEDGIYSYGVNSIIMYTRYHSVKNIQQQKILDLLQLLLQHIQTGEEVNLSLKAYEMLIQKLKDSFLENEIKEFKTFLKIWEESYRQVNDQENSSFQNAAQNRLLIESIIHKIINAMIGSVGINKIYQQIIFVYDQHNFQHMIDFEEMLISITKKDELKSQFFRGLFSYLLSYLAVCRGNGMGHSLNKISLVKQISGPTLITKKWPSINSSKSYEAFINDYENVLDIKTKKQVIETLKRWTKSYRFIEINQIIKYNSSLILNSFLFNIHECFLNDLLSNNNIKNTQQQSQTASKNFANFLSSQFCQSFCKSAEIQQRVSLVNQLFDQVRFFEVQDRQKLHYLQMANNLMYEQWIQSSKIIEFCHIDSDYSNAINLQLISQTNILINKFTQKMTIKQIDQIAYFLYSIFDFLNKVSTSYQQIIPLLTSSIKIVQNIERSHGSLIILSLTERMAKALNNEMDKKNFFLCWDMILNCAYILFSSPRNYNRDFTKKTLNEIYIKITLNQQLKSSFLKLYQNQFDQRVQKILVDAFGHLSESQQEQNLLEISLPKPQDFESSNHPGSLQKIYELSSIAFRDMFSRGVSKAKGGFIQGYEQQISIQSQNNGFARANSIIREQDIGHQEKSIADVMDMINF